jgi:molybdopterin-guanine dinucleotide biosynthesis protein MobB
MVPSSSENAVRVLAIVGRPGTGRTALLERLIPVCAESGPVGVVTEVAGSEADLAPVGTDPWRATRAGASVVVASSAQAHAVHRRQPLRLREAVELLLREHPELRWILVEGFTAEAREIPGARIIALLRHRREFEELFPGPGAVAWIAISALDSDPLEDGEDNPLGSVEEVVRRVRRLASPSD